MINVEQVGGQCNPAIRESALQIVHSTPGRLRVRLAWLRCYPSLHEPLLDFVPGSRQGSSLDSSDQLDRRLLRSPGHNRKSLSRKVLSTTPTTHSRPRALVL